MLQFDNGIIAEVSCSVLVNQENARRILGSLGRIEVPNFWFANGDRAGGEGKIDIIRNDGTSETIITGKQRHLYSFEADAAVEAIRAGRQEFAAPGMTWADSLGNARVLDKWRADAGIEYVVEKPATRTYTLTGRPLASGGGTIPKRSIPGLTKTASVAALGFEDFRSFASGAILLDAFWEKGGNVFNTGFIYAGGYTERLFGDWHTSRGTRQQAVLIGKGAHSPLCYPDVIAKQLDVSLDRLKTDYVDVYFMHRDNTDVPVGEFVDAMDAEVKKGRIWYCSAARTQPGPHGRGDRLCEAHRQAPGALSNNFALAEMINPIWAGCIAASDSDYKAWLTQHQIPNFSWSSQARGFFTDRAGRDKRDNAELVNTWYSDKNFGRRDRAIELANRLGKSPIHIALAYVLAQPFPSIPLIGPRTLAELDDSSEAFGISLTPEQLACCKAEWAVARLSRQGSSPPGGGTARHAIPDGAHPREKGTASGNKPDRTVLTSVRTISLIAETPNGGTS